MKNFTTLLLICLVLFSCKKENEAPINSPRPPSPPPPNPAPVTTVSIFINSTPMNTTSLTYERHGTGTEGGISITASNSLQKVTAVASPFYQYSPWSMIYVMEVSYFTRMDSLSGWGATYPRPVPRNEEIRFDNFTPLSDKLVKGNFLGTFLEGSSPIKEGHRIVVTGNFSLVF